MPTLVHQAVLLVTKEPPLVTRSTASPQCCLTALRVPQEGIDEESVLRAAEGVTSFFKAHDWRGVSAPLWVRLLSKSAFMHLHWQQWSNHT